MVSENYALSKCDYLVGPPSSFTAWAAYFGNIPLLILKDKDMKADIQNFEEQIYPDNPDCL